MTRLEFTCKKIGQFHDASGNPPGALRMHRDFYEAMHTESPMVARWVGHRGIGETMFMGWRVIFDASVHSVECISA